MGSPRLLYIALVGVLATFAARADIYAFVDANAVTHFSNVPTDNRYTLVLKSQLQRQNRPEAIAEALLRRSQRYDGLIEDAARAAAVDSQLLRAMILVESGFDERAVSRRGARGLMQLMPATARRYGARDLFNPSQNIGAGARYLRDLLDRYDRDLELALAAYNAGEDAVDRYRGMPPFEETRAYVPRVLGVYTSLRGLSERT
jgi:soluble lytic murein transglycosylase-like protein